tara:strand:- start:597 stop:1364 length:768 start_codon:yes stop_codon:yes gene_type:complete
MDIKVIKGVENYLYDDDIEFRAFNPDEKIIGNWREGSTGDWVFTDDMHVLQIIKRSGIKHPGYKKPRSVVLTVCGSFIVEQKTHQILGEHGVAENIFTFSGNYNSTYDRAKKRKLKSREFLFARYVAAGEETVEAYKKAYPKAKSEKYIQEKSSILLNKEEVRTMVKEEIKKILADEGISPEWIVGKYKDIAELSDRDTDKLRSLEALAKMSGLFDTERKQEQLTVFQGFTPEQMEALGGKSESKLIAHKEKDED